MMLGAAVCVSASHRQHGRADRQKAGSLRTQLRSYLSPGTALFPTSVTWEPDFPIIKPFQLGILLLTPQNLLKRHDLRRGHDRGTSFLIFRGSDCWARVYAFSKCHLWICCLGAHGFRGHPALFSPSVPDFLQNVVYT